MDHTTNHLLWLIDQGGHTADIARKILIEEQNMSIYHWMGAGWYAPRGELDGADCPECGQQLDEVWAGLLTNGQWIAPRCKWCATSE